MKDNRETGFFRESGSPRARLWPSAGEYPVYDAALYAHLEDDVVRNRHYQRAIAALAPGLVALDIGTGRELLWARACLDAGARHVYAVEMMPESFAEAQQTITRLGLDGRITLIRGRSDEIELPEPVDLCVSEIIGCIGSSEGALVALEDARRRHLRPDGAMIPYRCQTRIAAATLPQSVHERPRFCEAAAAYAARIFDVVGGPFDLRLLVDGLGTESLLSSDDLFEDDLFVGSLITDQSQRATLHIDRPGRLDGLVLWVRLWCMPGEAYIDVMRDDISWWPLFFPIFYPGVQVQAGDSIALECRRSLSTDGIHPDYIVDGVLRISGGERSFSYRSSYQGGGFRSGPLYAELFRGWPRVDAS